MSFLDDVDAWAKESQKGLICGIFGCNEPVEVRYSTCKYGYCAEHKDSHHHFSKIK